MDCVPNVTYARRMPWDATRLFFQSNTTIDVTKVMPIQLRREKSVFCFRRNSSRSRSFFFSLLLMNGSAVDNDDDVSPLLELSILPSSPLLSNNTDCKYSSCSTHPSSSIIAVNNGRTGIIFFLQMNPIKTTPPIKTLGLHASNGGRIHPQCRKKPQTIPAKCPMKLTRGIINCATNKLTIGAKFTFSHGKPGTSYVEKHTSLKNGMGHVAPRRSMVLMTIHAKSTAEYPTEDVFRSLVCISV
mmetsp:Transcript_34450/g.72593  ORF Transcript_34450/g.72593 Transcript_34450/m.72593 type:complete len:243 (-) Transcript_34450:531-1259(-)